MNEYITLAEAVRISGKSLQTVRRMVKNHKIYFKKERVPQGFVYLIDKDSLMSVNKLDIHMDTRVDTHMDTQKNDVTSRQNTENDLSLNPENAISTREHRAVNKEADEDITDASKNAAEKIDAEEKFLLKEMGRLGKTIEKLVEQSEKDKENFFHLIRTFQERIIVLENHIRLLEAPKKKKKWWHFGK